MERLKRFIVSTPADGGEVARRPSRAAARPACKTARRVTIGAEPQAESGAESRARTASARSSNPIERYIACFATVGAAAQAAGVSAAMLRRMRACGYVSTRQRALLMAHACRFKVKPADLLALTAGGR